MTIEQAIYDPTKDLTPEQLKQFGTIITPGNSENVTNDSTITNSSDIEASKAAEPHTVSIDHKIKNITAPVGLSLNLSPEQHERLLRLCSNNDQTPAEYITDVVLADLESRIGRASITGPSRIGGVTVGRKVTGPSRGK